MAGTYPGLYYPGQAYPGDTPSAAGFLFRTPVVQRPLTPDRPEFRPFHRIKIDVALSVLKNGSAYTTVENPTDEDVSAADIAYVGGHDHIISSDEAAALTAAGYTVEEL